MARITSTTEHGKLGDKIYYTWHGRQCERAMPTHVTNPQTEAQQSHRNAFATISKLSSYMKEAHLVGLHWQAVREHNSTYALFKHLNKDSLTSDGQIDYPRVVISKGPVATVVLLSAAFDNGILTVTFDGSADGDDASDEFYLYAYFPAFQAGCLAKPVFRCTGVASVHLPEEWLTALDTETSDTGQTTLYLYAFFRDRRGRTSDSLCGSVCL